MIPSTPTGTTQPSIPTIRTLPEPHSPADAHPIIGRLPIDGLFIAAGFSGAGFKKGPAVGQSMAELVLNGQTSFVDLGPFRMERFEEPGWDRPWSDSEYVLSADFGHKF